MVSSFTPCEIVDEQPDFDDALDENVHIELAVTYDDGSIKESGSEDDVMAKLDENLVFMDTFHSMGPEEFAFITREVPFYNLANTWL